MAFPDWHKLVRARLTFPALFDDGGGLLQTGWKKTRELSELQLAGGQPTFVAVQFRLRMRTLDDVAWSLSTSSISACCPRGVHGGDPEVDYTSSLISPGSSSALSGGLSIGLSPNLRGADGLRAISS